MTTQALKQGRVDPEGMREVVRAMSSGTVFDTSPQGEDARQAFTEAIKGLDQALAQSAQAAHSALEQLAARGKDYTDNDLKEALASLRKMQEDYVATANRVAQAATGNLRRELLELALHTQRVGADASVRMATVMNELALRMGSSYRAGASSGLEAARTYSTRMALVASGVLAGVADALRDQASGKKST
jgi:phosphoribosyl-ATP pyrophosphohydrolase